MTNLVRRAVVALALLVGFIGIAAPAYAAPAKPSAQDSFYMVNQNSNRCAEVPGYTQSNGAHVDQYTCVYDWHTNEMWYFKYAKRSDGRALYEIINTSSGRCMNVPGSSTANGAGVVQWTCSNGAMNGLWYIDENHGYHIWRNGHSGKCLNVAGAAKSNGAWLVQYDCGNYSNEHWKYVSLCNTRPDVCLRPPWSGW